MSKPCRIAVAALALLPACAGVPAGRYGVASVRIEGLSHLDDSALAACLGTRQRARFGVDVGLGSASECGTPPFDSHRLRLDFFSWPWTEWPLFDASVFERDVARVERWLHARGYYDGRVLASDVYPAEALGPTSGGEVPDHCVADEAQGCEVSVGFRIEEGEPVRVRRIEIRGDPELDPTLRPLLRSALGIHRDEVFDEVRYDASRRAMARVLADHGFPDAVVEGEAKVNAARHEAFVLFTVRPGVPGVIGRVCVSGHGPLPPAPIVAAAYLAPGQPFSQSALEEAQRAIFALGTLSSVEIRHRTEEAPSGEVENPEPIREADPDADPDPDPDADADPTTDADADAAADPDSDAAADAGADAAADAGADAAADAAGTVPAPPPYCTAPPSHVPPGQRAVDLEIRVTPGRLERLGLGLGWQVGDTLGFGSQAASGNQSINQQQLQQWDLHLLLVAEWRNLFGDMLRVRLEERPRLIFPAPFPGVDSPSGLGPSLGNRISLSVRWPAFLEARTALFGALGHDYGPVPLYGFFRHELDARVGLERTFFDGRLYMSGALRGNLFVPDQGQSLRVSSQRETTRALFLEQIVTVDLRDDPRNPREGAFFAVGLQEAGLGGASSWDYIRVTAEARGYLPLPAGIVLAARFGVGALILGDRYGLDPNNIYDLYDLGPLSQQLQGGGAIDNRGFPPGLEGDVVRRSVESRPLPDGSHTVYPPIIVSGGTRRWSGSLELRLPITPDFGLVAFADVGNVSRGDDFHFEMLNFAFGAGLRYRTIVGPLRLDLAFRPDALQYLGTGPDPRAPACQSETATNCRPVPLLFSTVPGAIHVTIGEAF